MRTFCIYCSEHVSDGIAHTECIERNRREETRRSRIEAVAQELLVMLKEAVAEHPHPKQVWLDLISLAEGKHTVVEGGSSPFPQSRKIAP